MINQQFYRRRDLIPGWMKFFMWVFMLLLAGSILARLSEITGIIFWFNSGETTIYGMETFESYSLLGFFITSILFFKGITAFGMWTEKDWAIKFGIIDAGIGIVICSFMMFIEPLFESYDGDYHLNFRFELLLLIPYLIKCLKIRKPWEEMTEFNILKMMSAMNQYQAQTVPVEETESEEPVEEKIDIEEDTAIEEKIDKEDPRRFMPNNNL